jgi:hypothetical protein
MPRSHRIATQTVPRLFHMTPQLAAEIDEYRFAHRIRSESETIRILIRIALDAEAAKADEQEDEMPRAA